MAPTPVFSPGASAWTEEPGGLQSTGSQKQSDMAGRLNNQKMAQKCQPALPTPRGASQAVCRTQAPGLARSRACLFSLWGLSFTSFPSQRPPCSEGELSP